MQLILNYCIRVNIFLTVCISKLFLRTKFLIQQQNLVQPDIQLFIDYANFEWIILDTLNTFWDLHLSDANKMSIGHQDEDFIPPHFATCVFGCCVFFSEKY